jgi:hypothetical protein
MEGPKNCCKSSIIFILPSVRDSGAHFGFTARLQAQTGILVVPALSRGTSNIHQSAQLSKPLRDDFFELCCFFDFTRASLALFFLFCYQYQHI